jgi:hypothetical protein
LAGKSLLDQDRACPPQFRFHLAYYYGRKIKQKNSIELVWQAGAGGMACF